MAEAHPISRATSLAPGVKVGTAGWAIPRAVRAEFSDQGDGLERYASVFSCVEINSTFKRVHQPKTFARWGRSVPAGFRFSVKAPASISHDAQLKGIKRELMSFLDGVSELGAAQGPILLQLPPSARFNARRLGAFVAYVSEHGRHQIVCEPRHQSWFCPKVEEWLEAHKIARVAADPARHPTAGRPGGWKGLAYYRLHGSPRMYYSAYELGQIERVGKSLLTSKARNRWCVFDNTASGAATTDALQLLDQLTSRRHR